MITFVGPWLNYYFFENEFKLRAASTEIWDFENGSNRTIDPAVPGNDYVAGSGICLVPVEFCEKLWISLFNYIVENFFRAGFQHHFDFLNLLNKFSIF